MFTWAPAEFFPGVDKLQSGDKSPLAGSRDGAPVGVWGRSLHRIRRQFVKTMHK